MTMKRSKPKWGIRSGKIMARCLKDQVILFRCRVVGPDFEFAGEGVALHVGVAFLHLQSRSHFEGLVHL